MGTAANLTDWTPVAPAPAPLKQALLGQESGNNDNAPTSVDGAVGKAQIEPATFSQYALPDEKMDNPIDYNNVYNRIVDHLYAKSGQDPIRTAVGYFSGPGNIAPAGSAAPYKNDAKDGNGKSTSSYASDIQARLSPTVTTSQTTPMSQVTTQPDLSDWQEVPAQTTMTDADIAKLPWYDRLGVDMAKNPNDYTIGHAAKSVAKSIGSQMLGGASDLYDLVTGNSGSGMDKAKAAFNQKYQNGDATSGDVKDLYLQGFANNPGGKAMGAARLFPPAAVGAAAFNDIINPALEKAAEYFGLDKQDVPLAEIPLALAGAKAGKASASDLGMTDYIPQSIKDLPGKMYGKASAAMNDFAGEPVSSTIPATMSKTVDSGQPLIISNSGAREGIQNFGKFADTDGIDLNKTADTLEQMQKTNPDARAIDAMTKTEGDIPTGANISGLAKSIANSPGQGRTMLAQMSGRGQQAADRIGSAFDTAISDKPYAKVNAGAIQAKEGTAPMYQEAFAQNQSMNSPKINEILNRPAGKQALKDAAVTMQNDGRLLGVSNPDLVEQAALTGQDIPKGGIASGLKMQTLHYVKGELWKLAQNETDPKTGNYTPNGRAILDQYHTLNNEMAANDATRTPNVPDSGLYAQANKQFSTAARVQQAQTMGGKYITDTSADRMRPESAQSYLNDKAISDPEKAGFLSGVRDQLQTIADRKNVGQNPIGKLSSVDLQKKLGGILGKGASAMSDFLANEAHMAKNDQLLAGSQTHANEVFGNKAAEPHTLPARIAGEIPIVGGAAGYLIDKGLAKTNAKMSVDSKAMIARILTTKDPAELRALAKRPGK